MKEFWKDITIKGVKPMYQVSNFGRIRNKQTGKLRLLNQRTKKGYVIVELNMTDRKQKKFRVHRIVCSHFKPARYVDQVTVNHKDGNHENNHIDNLEWMSIEENNNHAMDTGINAWGELSENTNLTNAIVHEICRMFQATFTVQEVYDNLHSRKIEITKGQLKKIKYRQRWKRISKDYKW